MSLLHVGRYAAFIWPAYGLSVLVIGGLILDTLLRSRRWRRLAARRDEERTRKRAGAGLP